MHVTVTSNVHKLIFLSVFWFYIEFIIIIIISLNDMNAGSVSTMCCFSSAGKVNSLRTYKP